MPSRHLVRSFVLLWGSLGLALFYWSVLTAQGALSSAHGANPHVALLGGVEAVAALFFLVPRTMRLGAAGLIATCLLAFLLHTAQHEFRLDLLVLAVAVLFVAVHGPLSKELWLRARI